MEIKKEKIKRILLIRPEMIGDYVIITPCIRALRQTFPDAKIAIFIKEFTRPLVETNPELNEILTDPGQILSGNFDLAIDFYGHPKYAKLIYKAKIPFRIGDGSRLLLRRYYTHKVFINWRNFTRHYLECYLELLKPLGIEVANPKIAVAPTLTALLEVEKILPCAEEYIGIHIGTGGGNRALPPANLSQIINLLHSQLQLKVVLLGGEKEAAKAQAILQLCKISPKNLAGKITLPQLVALLSKLKLYLGTDTGPLHIAAGLKVPIVAIMPTKFVKPTQWGPWDTKNIILRPRNPCPKLCNPRTCTDLTCLNKITPADCVTAVKILLNGGGNQNLGESQADWIKKSLNILLVAKRQIASLEYLSTTLRKAGWQVYTLQNPSIKSLLNLIIKEDINVMHILDGKTNLKVRLAALLANLKCGRPLLMVFGGNPAADSQTTINWYRSHLQERIY
jgi:ADP-heptose:LPS heptosyltransferase